MILFLKIILLIFLIKVLIDGSNYIHFFYDFLFHGRPWAAVPLSNHIKNVIVNIINKITDTKKYTFIDFGCGDGNVIDVVHDKVNKAVCIELEKSMTDLAEKRFKRKQVSAETSSPLNITILNMDMLDYKYVQTPTILFMYEPLWSMKKEDALALYHKIIGKIPTGSKIPFKGDKVSAGTLFPFYLIYVSGLDPYLDETFFNKYDFKMLEHIKLSRFLGLKKNNIYVFKRVSISS